MRLRLIFGGTCLWWGYVLVTVQRFHAPPAGDEGAEQWVILEPPAEPGQVEAEVVAVGDLAQQAGGERRFQFLLRPDRERYAGCAHSAGGSFTSTHGLAVKSGSRSVRRGCGVPSGTNSVSLRPPVLSSRNSDGAYRSLSW